MVRRSNKEKRITLLNELLKDSSRSDRVDQDYWDFIANRF